MKPHVIILLGIAGLISAVSVPSGSALAQQEFLAGPPSQGIPCPQPATMTISATATPSINAQDFPVPLSQGQGVSVLGRGGMDQTFRYTFNWKISDKLCCEITKAVLTVKVKWNGPTGPSTAGNDTISIVHNGSSVVGLGGYTWGNPSATPSTTPYTGGVVPNPSTKDIVINLNPAALANINAGHHLSFAVQDDTSVLAATLVLTGCCVTHF